ncbi:MAG: hypothetical protein HRU18_01630 [Pseudoalteromonas sp.]|uniref:hypothetical protein n=1 Tax=Pseudoalteromonas sp. TaxID=53249 RepID=UPI001DC0B17F|nr:hypothetical protein [Pseudoalteromonas sp.]NRA76882.1 hypothetical protein [Pseudoalteromonas sp.]
MALSFSNDQLKTMSLDVLELPFIIDFPLDPVTGEGGTGLVQQQQNVLVEKDKLYTTDQQNKIFTDHWTGVADKYHEELETLSLTRRTTYLDSDLELGGKSLPPHYTPTHPELVPIVIPSLNGLPTAPSSVPENESPKLNRLNEIVNTYINGKSGSKDDELTGTWTDGQPVSTQSGTNFSNGEIVFMIQGSNVMMGQVTGTGGSCTGETPPNSGVDEATCTTNGGTWETSINITALTTPKTFTSGAEIRNYSPAFSNAKRGRQTPFVNNEQALAEFFEEEINLNFQEIVDYIQSVIDILSANEDTNGGRKTDNQTYLDALNAKITEHTTWSSVPINQVDGKYTDDELPVLQSSFLGLTALNTNRITQIQTMLGSVTDNGGGDVSGDGVYFDLWKFLVIRLAKSGGTLYGWYGMDLAVSHFDTKIANANSQLTEYQNIFVVKKITEDVALGENEVSIENTTELSETDSIKVFDNETPVFSTTIQEINGNIVTLAQGLPTELLTGNLARLVKEK